MYHTTNNGSLSLTVGLNLFSNHLRKELFHEKIAYEAEDTNILSKFLYLYPFFFRSQAKHLLLFFFAVF